jgi:hypothetical protein
MPLGIHKLKAKKMKQLTFSKRIEDSEFWSLEKTYPAGA